MSTQQSSHVEAIEPNEVEQPQRPSLLRTFTGATPWWVVSTLLHVLIIALASLVCTCISLAEPDDGVPQETRIFAPPEINKPLVKLPPDDAPIFNPPYGPAEGDQNPPGNGVEVPPEMRARAKISDHIETIDPERPDNKKAFGNPDAEMLMRDHGDDDFAGGGGIGGDNLSDSIGVGGVASPGTHGGWGGGDGPGIGTQHGSGHGNWGSRTGGGRDFLITQNCGRGKHTIIKNTESALQWLAYHQEADGHWDTVKFGSAQKTDTAMTGMALLAFAGAGHSERVGQYKDNVKRAVAWLKSKQQPNGLIFDSTDAGAHRGIGYPHAIATLGLVEAAGMGNVKETRAAAQRAIDYAIEIHQQGDGSDKLGWRYAPKTPGDLSVTGWFVMAMKSAKIAGLHVNPATFEGAIKFLDSVEFKDAGGDAAYGSSHFGYQPGNEHAGTGHRLTAIGSLVRQFCGWSREQTQGSVDWFVNKGGVPNWGANGESVDLYYWYYGSLSTFQQGGDVWKRWNAAMMKALTENQCKSGDDAGSWPIAGEFSGEWGRVGQTALGVLCLEVYYRYEKLKN